MWNRVLNANLITMKKLTILFLLLTNLIFSQEFKEDNRPQEEIEFYSKSNDIQKLDILQALDELGVQIHKFDLGDFEKKYNLTIIVEKFQESRIIKKDTIFNSNNTYEYYDDEGNAYYDFIKELKIITKELEEESKLLLNINGYKRNMKIHLPKSNDITFFEWREYKDTEWKLNKKTPLLMYASSWRDKDYDIERFCGVRYLDENSEGEEEIFTYSPNYAIISYKITE